MVYQVFGAVPEWAPPGQDHILYSRGVLKSVSYTTGRVGYTPTDSDGVENLRLTFAPQSVTIGGTAIAQRGNLLAEGYTVRDLGGGDWAVSVRRQRAGAVVVSSTGGPAPTPRPVAWDRATVVGVAASVGSLSKTAATAWGNGGAASLDRIESGDGYVELTASETTTYRMIGLGNGNGGSHYADIEYALYLAQSALTVYESGVARPVSVPYAPGDVLRVAVVSGVVKYSRNGTVFYTSTVPPRYPLVVDTALFDLGATLGNVATVGAAGPVQRRRLATSLVDWSPDSAIGVSVDGSSVTRTARSGTAGAASVQLLESGEGYVELTAKERAPSRMIGLSRGSSSGWRGIDFALLLRRDRRDRDGAVHVYESGARRRIAVPWREGDVLRVGIVDGTVEYSRNGVVFYRSRRAPAYPLRVETALFREGDTLSDVTVARAVAQ
jgi:hypothetical protein